ncbi:CPCC family cysteine-rich protein [Pseudomonas chlororaphis]|uniref:CPCC family cysteine-rich protein n=1 Tax=Pseudomonas chlororaphis TaxID=587753 RepID=UPI000F5851BA|nr:CPCC family cysteine-rich protein [Pseudomonas chlororaphis]
MSTLPRTDAIYKICKKILSSLDNDARESYILNWWGIDERDFEFSLLSKEMQNLVSLNDDPPSDTQNQIYNELIMIALSSEYKGVTNTYLSELMSKNGLGEYEVHGDIETLEACPCCGYRTLSSRANYDICGLCNWEDDGTVGQETYSGPNHMTLREGQEKFRVQMDQLPLNKWVMA